MRWESLLYEGSLGDATGVIDDACLVVRGFRSDVLRNVFEIVLIR